MTGIVGLIVALVMAVWIYLVVKKHGGQMPWLWAIGALVFWPLFITITGLARGPVREINRLAAGPFKRPLDRRIVEADPKLGTV